METNFRLSNATIPAKWLLTSILFVLIFGYLHGLGFVYLTTGIKPSGVEERYRGTEDVTKEIGTVNEIHFEKSLPEMFNIIHTHILSIGFIFIVVSSIFYFSSLSDGWKTFWSVEPFLAIGISFMAMWLMRYVHPKFSYLLLLSGILMAVAFFTMVFYSIYELWKRSP